MTGELVAEPVQATNETEIRRLLAVGNGILQTAVLTGVDSETVRSVRTADREKLMAV